MKILVTGAAGFIGYHLILNLVKNKDNQVVGIDNLNTYYDVNLKYSRLADCGIAENAVVKNSLIKSTVFDNYHFQQTDIIDYDVLDEFFKTQQFDYVLNMAAQAGVRYSIENPRTYVQTNLVGFNNLLECCRNYKIKHLLYASSSSVYGMNAKVPFSEDDKVDHPVSLYAATKKSNELMAHVYSNLFQLPTSGLRFFTVYGPSGRPDMSPMLFADAISAGRAIKVFNHGDMLRDFTYVDDIVEGVVRLIEKAPDASTERPYYRVFNLGNSQPVALMDFIKIMEQALGKEAKLDMLPMQPGDVKVTYADTTKLQELTNYKPSTSLKDGIAKFITWYNSYHSA
ncbi:NAD-dependent epimerase/dehydratase family protein [Mucilaginibacter terrigena]|uniref:NAD-dependent epimerase/dehydratase family protein n=1 Tax=Mucilaginibacter terrigena TaxID=2492395 RepID=A0A4Q5LMK9_9SPHI|nr:NAD-dependent epimerase/dehydratase family protein [Mucilaginibacter terrigena]RYU90225.1 NAD-dependent epimerase/dehydratase family protein [Mucilaginibacter terrigena]